MNKIKKVIVLLVVAILCMNINVPVIYAEDIAVYISVSSSQVNVGDSITVTVSYSYSGSFAADFQLGWSGPIEYSGGSIGGSGVISAFGNGSASATFTATGAGTASFSVSGAGQDVVTEADLAVSPQGASVTISDSSSNNDTQTSTTEENTSNDEQTTTEEVEDDGKSDNAFLSSLSISPGTLNPEFSPYTTSYTAQVDEDVTEISVSATADDINAGISVWGANDLSLGENWVQVAVTAENGDVRYYDIYVMVGEDVGKPVTEIDGVKYSFIDYEDGLEPPEGFESSTLKYEKWEVISYKSPNGKINIVPLVPEENDEGIDYEWYIYQEEKNCFVKYHEYSSKYNRYVIIDVSEGVKIPDGYNEIEIAINEIKVKAYQPDKNFFKEYDANMNIYLVYAINIEGDAGFYNYDLQEDTFLRYNPLTIVEEVIVEATPTEATPIEATPTNVTPNSAPDDEGFFTKQVLIYCLCGAGALLLVLLFCLIAFGSRIKSLNGELDKADDMINQLATDKKTVDRSVLNNDKAVENSVIKNDKSVESIKDIELPDVDELVNQVNALSKKSIKEDKSEEQKTDEKIAYEDFEKQSKAINDKLKEDYDAEKDSAFADDNNK